MPRVALQTRPIAHAGPQPARSVPEHQNGTSLGVLLIWLVLFWAGLKFLVGWPPTFPAFPSAWPSWPTIEVWLGSALLPTDWLIPSVGLVAWVIWGWTTVFVVVRLTLNGLEAATQGAAWVRSLVRATDWLMLPPYDARSTRPWQASWSRGSSRYPRPQRLRPSPRSPRLFRMTATSKVAISPRWTRRPTYC